MKVYLYITPFFPTPDNWRGAYCYDFVVALQRQFRSKTSECRVVVMTEGDGTDYEIGGVKVYTFRVKRLPSNIFPNLFAKRNQASFIDKVEGAGEKEGWRLLDVAVCHGHTANYGIYPLAIKNVNPKCKTLLHHHDPQSFGLNMGILRHCWFYNMIEFPILRRMHEQIDTHVFISKMVKKSFIMAPDTSWTSYEDYKKQMRGLLYRPVKIKDSIILHNGVDKRIFNLEGRGNNSVECRVMNVERREESKDSVERMRDGEFVIGCIGNFIDWKDQITLLKAVKVLSTKGDNSVEGRVMSVERKGDDRVEGGGIKVRFVGSGPCLEECKRYAEEHKIDAEFLTEMRHEQLPDFYKSLDLFVLPSYFEGFGCVFTEAYACGVPFITCEGQGMDDYFNNGKWLCMQKNPDDLVKKMVYYMSKREKQVLKDEIAIDILIERFLKEIGCF